VGEIESTEIPSSASSRRGLLPDCLCPSNKIREIGSVDPHPDAHVGHRIVHVIDIGLEKTASEKKHWLEIFLA
jgi:hypothetical protein